MKLQPFMKSFLIPYVILVRFTLLSHGLQYTYEPFISDPNYNVIFYKSDKFIGKVESETFSIGDEFTHCNAFSEGNNLQTIYPFQMAAGFIDRGREKFVLTKCLSSFNKWIQETSFSKCFISSSSLIIGIIPKLADEEIIVISCNTPSQDIIKEIFISEYPKLQVLNLYTDLQRNITKNLPDIYLSHGMKIPCLPSDPSLTSFNWEKETDNGLPDFSKGQNLIVDIDKNDEIITSKYPLNKYSCTLHYYQNQILKSIILKFSFYVESSYQTDIKDVKGTFGRREFDVGETIQCVVSNASNKKGDRSIYLYIPEPMILLTDTNTKKNALQPHGKYLKIAPQPSIVSGESVYLKCIILGEAKSPYEIQGVLITLLTNNVSDFYSYKLSSGDEAIKCFNDSDKVYIFRNDIYQLPLSKLLKTAKFINVHDNYSVKMDFQWSALEWYFVVCFDTNGTAKTPVVLNIGREPVLIIESVFPPYNQLTRYQMKGFVYKCYTNNNNFSVEWSCSQCLPNEMQKIIYTGSKLSMDLEIITDTKMEITYVCRATLPNNKYIEKNLSLSLLGSLLVGLVKPRFFYTFNDPVRCSGNEMYSYTMTKIVLPVKLMYENSTHKFEESTALGTDPFNSRAWTPIIPLHLDYQNSPWKFSACCIKYDMGKMVCGPIVNIEVIVNYTFKYNYDIPGEIIYPGNIMKCCILRRNSLEPNKASMDGDALYNCLPAQILFYANKDRSATPANPGVLMYEGTQISVPEEFEGNDITRAAAFVKCYSDDHARKATDLLTSAIQLNIKSCLLSPPPLIMLPEGQTLFLTGDFLLCISQLKECKSGLQFDFRIERGGQQIDKIENSVLLMLTNKYLGNYIKVTCYTGTQTIVSASRDISVESLPFNMVINGSMKIMTNNKLITCSSEGFPPPTIIWTDVEKQSYLLIDDSVIIIRNWDKNGKYVYTCTALNKHGEISQTITFHIFNINMKDSIVSVKFYVILYLELFLYFVFILFILTFIFKEYLTAPEGPRFLIKGVK